MHDIERRAIADDGLVPNNADVELRLYRRVLPSGPGAEEAIEGLFARHGWGAAWVDGIYDFQHYHARAHEVLGIANGWVDVQLGGPTGQVVRLEAGDAVMIPAGVGHCRCDAGATLSVVGAYPKGQEDYDLKRPPSADREAAKAEIAAVALPERDPITGKSFGE